MPRLPAARSSRHRLLGGGLGGLGAAAVAAVEDLRQLAQVARDADELGGHDRHVDEDQRQEDEVRGGDVRAGVVERQRGHQSCCGAAVRPAGTQGSSSSASRRFSARSCIDACLDVSSYFHSVTNSVAIASTETRNVSRIAPGIEPPVALRTRGGVNDWASRTARKFSGTNAPATIENTAAVRAWRSRCSIEKRSGW